MTTALLSKPTYFFSGVREGETPTL